MERIINTLLGAIVVGILVGFALGLLVGYAWRGLRQMDREMKQAELDRQQEHERKKQRYKKQIEIKRRPTSIDAYYADQAARYSPYVEFGQVPAAPPDETNYLRLSEEDEEMMERIRQRVLNHLFAFPAYTPEDDQIARRLLDSLDSSDDQAGGDM